MSSAVAAVEAARESAREASRETRNWRDRVSGLNPESAKLLLTDPLLIRLDAVQFAVVVRLHAMTRGNNPLPARVKVAAKLLGLTPKRLTDTLQELEVLAPNLIREEAGLLVCDSLISRPFAAHAEKRSAAADARWDKHYAQDVEGAKATNHQVVSAPATPPAPRPLGFRRLQQCVPGAVAASESALSSATRVALNQGSPAQATLWADTELPIASNSTESSDAVKRPPACPYDELVALFHSTCVSLSRVRSHKEWTSTSRKTDVQRRWASNPTLGFWKKYFARVEASDRLTGRTDGPWRADFDWIMKPKHFDRIMEGVYDNRPGARRGLWNRGRSSAAPGTPMESDIDESAPFLQDQPEKRGNQ